MKKKLLGGLLVLAIAAIAAFNAQMDMQPQNTLSALSLANLEALASESGESGGENYAPDRYITAKTGEIEYTSNNSGEITVGGKTMGGYKRNATIKIPVEIKNCDGVQLNSKCNQNDVGITVL